MASTSKNVMWSLFDVSGGYFVQFTISIILARLLEPKDYGLLGMIIIFFAIANILVESGFSNALIQRDKIDAKDTSTVFFLNLIISSLVYLTFWYSAPLIAHFYNKQILIEIIRIASLTIIINSFKIVPLALILRSSQFKSKSIITIISNMVGGALGITLALLNYGVWSLIFMSITKSLISTGGYWFYSRWIPKRYFSISSIKKLFNFGSWLMLSSFLKAGFDNLYYLVIGKYYQVSELGFYTKSVQLQKIIIDNIANAMVTVMFPLFSQMQNNDAKIKEKLKKFNQFTILFLVPLIVLIIILSKPLINIILTEKWLPIQPFLKLLLIVGLINVLNRYNINVLLSKGKSRLLFYISFLKNSLRILNIVLFIKSGVIYIIFGEIAITLLVLIISTGVSKHLINYGIIEQFKDIYRLLFSSLLLIPIGLFIMSFELNEYLEVFLIVGILPLIYLKVISTFEKSLYLEAKAVSKRIFYGK